jgi:hypothetical protein
MCVRILAVVIGHANRTHRITLSSVTRQALKSGVVLGKKKKD